MELLNTPQSLPTSVEITNGERGRSKYGARRGTAGAVVVGLVGRSSFLRMPYLRDGLARMSVLVETFETACTWDRAPQVCERVRAELGAAIKGICGAGMINCG